MPAVSDNDGGLHSLLPPNRSLVYQYASRREPHSRGCHKQARHRSNTAWLEVLSPGRLARLAWCAPQPHPSSAHSECLDPRWLGCRFRFFLAHKGEQLIQLRLLHLLWQRCVRQFGSVGTHPVGNTLWVDLQYTPDRAITTAFYVHPDGKETGFLRITMLSRLWRIDPIAFTTAIALAP